MISVFLQLDDFRESKIRRFHSTSAVWGRKKIRKKIRTKKYLNKKIVNQKKYDIKNIRTKKIRTKPV
jgi:hypothetical protein